MNSSPDSPASQRDFSSFIAEWRRTHLAGLSKADLEAVAEYRAKELTQAAMETGHRAALSAASRPYRSMVEYVKALHDVQDTNHYED